jgi:hypothetical protein
VQLSNKDARLVERCDVANRICSKGGAPRVGREAQPGQTLDDVRDGAAEAGHQDHPEVTCAAEFIKGWLPHGGVAVAVENDGRGRFRVSKNAVADGC